MAPSGPPTPRPSTTPTLVAVRVPEELLLIPGPVSLSPGVRAEMGGPARAHYGGDWTERYRRLTAALAAVFRTEGEVFCLFGPGTAGLEACLASVLAPGDEILVGVNGLFGERLEAVARALGLQVHPVIAEDRRPLRPEAVAEAVRRHPGARALAVVHHETSLGLLNPIAELCPVARERGLLTIVDAVSSLGGVPLEMDAWGIDLCVGVSNKCLGGPVGLAPVAVGARAREALEDGRPKAAGWYLNLATWRRFADRWGSWHPHPTTMPTQVVDALAAALEEVMAVGLEAHQARLAAATARIRDGLRELGFELVVDDHHASPVTTAAWALPGMDVEDYLTWLREERRLRLGGGLGELAGRVFRVGTMGEAARPGVVDAYLSATAEYLERRRRS
jgi:alanine-glyoxylate transaminase/serine-glyoxylate transaminase/serine-pyruvate transaminase